MTGPNGGGKSTLLGALLGRMPLVAGRSAWVRRWWWGRSARSGRAMLGAPRLIDAFTDGSGLTPQDARSLLAKFGLDADRVARPAADLSPGERTRALMAALAAREASLLVLDEPTNHLDLEAIEQLEEALDDYAGTLLLVTHDRRMLERVAITRRLRVRGRRRDGGGVSTFVLVPGAMATGRHWAHVVAALRGLGHEALAPDLPSGPAADLRACAAAVAAAAGDRRDVVVVSHSLGGFTAPLAADRIGAAPARAGVPDDPGARRDGGGVVGGDRMGGAPGAPRACRPRRTTTATSSTTSPRSASRRPSATRSARVRPGCGRTRGRCPRGRTCRPGCCSAAGDRFFPPAFVRRLAAERLGDHARRDGRRATCRPSPGRRSWRCGWRRSLRPERPRGRRRPTSRRPPRRRPPGRGGGRRGPRRGTGRRARCRARRPSRARPRR